jgi:hypothetical protein
VLVIIGLIVGGVLVGQDLIRAAAVRAAIAQIEKYNTAVNTFRGKYNALPGDMNAATATQFGFTPRGQYEGEGDGNGVLEGVSSNSPGQNGAGYEGAGETAMFWVDLSTANGLNVDLIDGAFSAASPTTWPSPNPTGAAIDQYLPQAKLGQGNYIYAYSVNGTNYYGLSAATDLVVHSNVSLTVQQAYSIDKKIDDGLPQTGTVITGMANVSGSEWVQGGLGFYPTPYTTATAGSSATCFDNGNIGGAPMVYSLEINGGAGANCALSFQFQ